MTTLGVFLQRRLKKRLFTVPSIPVRDMPLFRVTDLPLVAVVPIHVWFSTVQQLRLYQRNLSVTAWSGLEAVYPRSHIWAYLHFLFEWARYCNRTAAVANNPDRSVVAEMFIRYICQMDDYLDQFDSRDLVRQHPQHIRHLPGARAISTELCCLMDRLGLPNGTAFRIKRVIVAYWQAYFAAMRRFATHPTQDLAHVLADKEAVAGGLWHTWATILGILYDVPDDTANQAADLWFNTGMFIQVIDDIADLPVDFRTTTQNILLAVVDCYPQEQQRLQTHLTDYHQDLMDWVWLRKHLTQSYAHIQSIYRNYGEAMLRHQTPVATDLYRTVERVRTLTG